MRSVVPALRRLLLATPLTLVLLLGVTTSPTPAWADEEAPVTAGVTLVARGDCELQKVTITRGAKVQVTASSSRTADIALPDGHVLHHIPLKQVRYFFDVAR